MRGFGRENRRLRTSLYIGRSPAKISGCYIGPEATAKCRVSMLVYVRKYFEMRERASGVNHSLRPVQLQMGCYEAFWGSVALGHGPSVWSKDYIEQAAGSSSACVFGRTQFSVCGKKKTKDHLIAQAMQDHVWTWLRCSVSVFTGRWFSSE